MNKAKYERRPLTPALGSMLAMIVLATAMAVAVIADKADLSVDKRL